MPDIADGAYAQLLEHSICESSSHLKEELARVEALGGEGLMVRQPDGQTKTKTFESSQKADAEYSKLVFEKTSKGYCDSS